MRLSFRDVYEETASLAIGMARRFGVDDNDLDDLMQDVFMTVHRRLVDFEGRSSLKTWVAGIVLGFIRNHRRNQRRRGTKNFRWMVDVDSLDLPDARADPWEDVARREAQQALFRLLNELSVEKAVLLVLSDFEGMTVPEIARATNANLDTTYSRVRAARIDFSRLLTRMHRSAASGHRGASSLTGDGS